MFAFPEATGVDPDDLKWANDNMEVGKVYTVNFVEEDYLIALFEFDGVLLPPALFKKA